MGISNDDPSRALIAWDTAHAPSIDPTRSSWLPLHSLVLGALMAFANDPRSVPYLLSLGSGLVAIAALSVALRRERRAPASVVAALVIACSWRWSLYCAAAGAVPEMPAVALLCVAIERWCAQTSRRGWQAGVALTLASGMRYEPWFAVVGFAWANRARTRPRGTAIVAVLVAAIVPLGWFVLNYLHRGDALDFVHRVAAHRRLVAASPMRWWSSVAGVMRTLVVELPWVAPALVLHARSKDRSEVARVSATMALAVLGGLLLEAARGGGATHHGARTLLPVAWLLVPSLASAIDGLLAQRRGPWVAMAVLACVGWGAPRSTELDSMGSADAAAVGAAVARHAESGPWCLEFERQDALWVLWRSGASRRVIPDRVFGGPPSDASTRADRCAAARIAVTSSWQFGEALRERGFQVSARLGPWTLRVRPE